GVVLSSAGMAALVLGIIQGPNWGWGSGATVATIAGGLAILAIFVNVERGMDHPMLDISLFRNLRFTAASGSITTGFFTLAGFTFLITQYFQFIRGYSAFETGLRILPVAMSIAVAAVVGTRLAVKIGNKAVVATGLAMFGLALWWISTVSASSPYIVLVGQMIMGGGGLGLITAPATAFLPSRPRVPGAPKPVEDEPQPAARRRRWMPTPARVAVLTPQRTTASPSSDKVKA